MQLIIVMHLNLKTKRGIQSVINAQNKTTGQVRTFRQQDLQRQSREHKEIKSTRQHHNMNKKQTASTAMTMHPNHSYNNINNHFVIPRQEHQQKDFMDMNHSYEKIEISRNDKITKVYRKLKKFQTNDNPALLIQQDTSSQVQRDRTYKSKTGHNKNTNKKDMIYNLANNYITKTEADQSVQRKKDNFVSKSPVECYPQMLQILRQVFVGQNQTVSSARLKLGNRSSRQMTLNRSLERDSIMAKIKNKRSNQILIMQKNSDVQSDNSIYGFFQLFNKNVYQGSSRLTQLQALSHPQQKKQIKKMQKILSQIQKWMGQFYEKCITHLSMSLCKYQKHLYTVIAQEQTLKQRLRDVQAELARQKYRSSMLLKNLQEVTIKNLYASAFMNQLANQLDVHALLAAKIKQQAAKNGYISDQSSIKNQSRFDTQRQPYFQIRQSQNQFMTKEKDSIRLHMHSEVINRSK